MTKLAEDDIPADVLCHICGYCGMAVYRMEVAAEFSGKYIDYQNKASGHGSFILCGECWLRVKNSLEGDIEAAVEKRKDQLDEINPKDEEKNDKETESGGNIL